MPLATLIQLCPPPEKPLIHWTQQRESDVSAELGLRFPHDYIEFCKTYGSGFFGSPNTHQIAILDVFSPHRKALQRASNLAIRYVCSDPGFERRFRMNHIDKDSLFPLGSDGDRRYLIWSTDSNPSEWRIILVPFDEDIFEVFDCGVTDFLAGFFSGKLLVQAWQSRTENGKPQKYSFTPDPW